MTTIKANSNNNAKEGDGFPTGTIEDRMAYWTKKRGFSVVAFPKELETGAFFVRLAPAEWITIPARTHPLACDDVHTADSLTGKARSLHQLLHHLPLPPPPNRVYVHPKKTKKHKNFVFESLVLAALLAAAVSVSVFTLSSFCSLLLFAEAVPRTIYVGRGAGWSRKKSAVVEAVAIGVVVKAGKAPQAQQVGQGSGQVQGPSRSKVYKRGSSTSSSLSSSVALAIWIPPPEEARSLVDADGDHGRSWWFAALKYEESVLSTLLTVLKSSFPVPSSSVGSKAMVVWWPECKFSSSTMAVVKTRTQQAPSVAVALRNTAIVVWVAPVAHSSPTVHSKQVAVVRTTTILSTQVACYYCSLANDDDDDECPVPAQVGVLLFWMGLVALVAGSHWVVGNRREEQQQGPVVVAAPVVAVVPPVVETYDDYLARKRWALRRRMRKARAEHLKRKRPAGLEKRPIVYPIRKRMAAVVLQCMARQGLSRRRVQAARESLQESKAVVCLQAMVRMYLAQVQLAMFKQQVVAVRLMQKTWRSYRLLPLVAAPVAVADDDFALHDQHEDDDDEEPLQGLVVLAAVVLQGMARQGLARRRVRAARKSLQENKAAVCLQAMARMYLAQVQLAMFKQQVVAALVVQCLARQGLARRRVRAARKSLQENKAAVYLQAMVRMYLAQVQLAMFKQQVVAVRLMQKTWRSYRLLPLVAAPVAVADDDDFALHDQHEDDDDEEPLQGLVVLAAVVLQGMARQGLARRRVRAARKSLQENKAAVCLQAMARMYLAQVQLVMFKQQVVAVRLMQKTWRSYRYVLLPLVAAPVAVAVADDDDFPLDDQYDDMDDVDDELLQGPLPPPTPPVPRRRQPNRKVKAKRTDEPDDPPVEAQQEPEPLEQVVPRRRRPAARPAPREQQEPPRQEPPEPAHKSAPRVVPSRRRRLPARRCKKRPVRLPTRVQPDRACKNKARSQL